MKPLDILDLVCFHYYINQKEACSIICRDCKKDHRQFCCPRSETATVSEHFEIMMRNTW